MSDDTFRERKLGNIYGHKGGNYAGTIYDVNYISPVMLTCQGGNRQAMIVIKDKTNMNFRVRKLTPVEYFRLMGFTGKDVKKCRNIGMSDTQLYKQAGNSIVTNCVKLIAEHLYKAQYDNAYVCSDEITQKSTHTHTHTHCREYDDQRKKLRRNIES